MVNIGVVGAGNSMAEFSNNDANGVALTAYNYSALNTFNAIEGVTGYGQTGFLVSGVLGLGIYQGATNTISIGTRGTSNEWQGYGVYGTRFNSGGPNSGWGGLFLNDLGYTGGFFNASDLKLKKDISIIPDALNKILAIRGVNYTHKLDEYPYLGLGSGLQYGFIAQEIETIIPEAVVEKTFDKNGAKELSPLSKNKADLENFKTVNYISVIPILVEAIKEQQQIIESLKFRITELEKK
jgi:hypothetical protein